MREISSPIASDRGKFSPQAAQSLTSVQLLTRHQTALYVYARGFLGGV